MRIFDQVPFKKKGIQLWDNIRKKTYKRHYSFNTHKNF
jgi:hypothetical protein